MTTLVTGALGALVLGLIAGYFIRKAVALSRKTSLDLEIKQMLVTAKEESQKLLDESKSKIESKEEEFSKEIRRKTEELKQHEERLIKKDETLDARQSDISKHEDTAKEKEAELEEKTKKIDTLIENQTKKLEEVAGLKKEDAKEMLFDNIKSQYSEDLIIRTRKIEDENNQKLETRAKEILATSIQRLASSTAHEFMTTTINIPSDDIKGKIIGKEGRNIRAFERAAGVELIIDETPGTIVISSFDPVRRQIARVALENLIIDGRIQPAKIEESVITAKEEINKIIKKKGEEAVFECGILNLDPRIIAIIGRLYFRTSYGQNVLNHSIEMAHIAGMIAEELGADVSIAKAGALVHDIGKALDHEIQGTHIDIGIRILEKFGADPKVITAMKSHHDDWPHESIEAVIVQVADIISGGRPGARRDSIEQYLKRIGELETLATSFKGVEKSYALSAGREIRVFVYPNDITDIEAKSMAGDIARRIETELKYPGEIKVTVIRENRIIEYAR